MQVEDDLMNMMKLSKQARHREAPIDRLNDTPTPILYAKRPCHLLARKYTQEALKTHSSKLRRSSLVIQKIAAPESSKQ